jgi:hypothetical protein
MAAISVPEIDAQTQDSRTKVAECADLLSAYRRQSKIREWDWRTGQDENENCVPDRRSKERCAQAQSGLDGGRRP